MATVATMVRIAARRLARTLARAAAIAAILSPALVIGQATLALAHICSVPVEADVGEQVTLNVGVAVETADPLVTVTIALPEDGFRLDSADPAEGWTLAGTSDVVRYTDGNAPSGSCAFFTLHGEATQRGLLVFPITAESADGSRTEYVSTLANDPFSAQLLYAGVGVPGQGPTGVPPWVGAVAAIVLAAVVAVGVWAWKLVRAPAAPARPGPPPRSTGRAPGRPVSARSRPGNRTRRPSRRS
jgi:hypothetical protein